MKNPFEKMLQTAQKKYMKMLFVIGEASKTHEMVQFVFVYGKWLRANYPDVF